MRVFLGIDDTDVLGQRPGTGRVARELASELEANGYGRLVGVVRHQLLVDPRIPYTSHNSPACVILNVSGDDNGSLARLAEAAAAYVTHYAAAGSDPGICLAPEPKVAAAIQRFGYRASAEVVSKAEAYKLATGNGVHLEELGGTGDGIIGALAAVGLTADGNAGRFLEWTGGLRGLGEQVSVCLLRERRITVVSTSRNGEVVPADAVIATGDWLRPRLIGGRAVLLVEATDEGWRCFDRKQRHDDRVEET